jgi:hypothetical protein
LTSAASELKTIVHTRTGKVHGVVEPFLHHVSRSFHIVRRAE